MDLVASLRGGVDASMNANREGGESFRKNGTNEQKRRTGTVGTSWLLNKYRL